MSGAFYVLLLFLSINTPSFFVHINYAISYELIHLKLLWANYLPAQKRAK